MAIDLEASFATVVHDVQARARLEASFATVVHDVQARARLEASFATVVHTDAGAPGATDTGFTPSFLDDFPSDFLDT